MDERTDDLLAGCGRTASRLGLAIAWTDGIAGPAAKACTGVGSASWKNAKRLSSNVDAAAAFFAKRARRANPCVVASKSGLVLVENDGGDELLDRFGLELPATVAVRSRRGLHRYYRPPAGKAPLKAQIDPDGLVVSEDGYLVSAPAIHPSGHIYEYVNGAAAASKIATLDPATYDLIVQLGNTGRADTRARFAGGEPIPEGRRTDALRTSVLGWAASGRSADEVLALALDLNARQMVPPLDEQLVRKHVRGLLRWAAKHPTENAKARARARDALHGVEDAAPRRAAPKPRVGPLGWDWLTAIATKRVVWLDRPFWQASAFHLQVGRKGVGKGTMLADLAARFSRGELGEKRRVVWIGSEDSVSIDVKPRVLAAGGDPSQIAVVKDWLQLPRDVPRLAATIEQVGDVGLLVIDPVSNHIAGANSNDETAVREAIAHLNALADRFELVAVGVRHLTEKEAKSGLLAAILGSSAWVQVPRVVIALARDAHHEDVVHMQVVAGNRMKPGAQGRRFRIEAASVETDDGTGEVSRVAWDGDSTVDVEELLGIRHTPEPSRSEDARGLILATLRAAPGQRMNAEEFDALIADQAEVSAKTVRNLRSELGANGRGWLKAIPVKDEFGVVQRWDVGLTEGAPPDPGLPDPAPIHPESGSGLVKPNTAGFGRPDHPDPDVTDMGAGSGRPAEWLARDGVWRPYDTEPPAFPGEIVETRP